MRPEKTTAGRRARFAGTPGDIWAPLALASCTVFAPASMGASPNSAPRESPARDLAGPRIDVIGTVVRRVGHGPDPCLLVEVTGTPRAWLTPPLPAPRLVAVCSPGGLHESAVAVGDAVRVRGNLGPAPPRLAGNELLEVPAVAGAFVSIAGGRSGYGNQQTPANCGFAAPGLPYAAFCTCRSPYLTPPALIMGVGPWGGCYRGW